MNILAQISQIRGEAQDLGLITPPSLNLHLETFKSVHLALG